MIFPLTRSQGLFIMAQDEFLMRYLSRNQHNDLRHLYICVCACVSVCVCLCAQLCPTLLKPMDWSPPVSPPHGIFHARILGINIYIYIYIFFFFFNLAVLDLSWGKQDLRSLVAACQLLIVACGIWLPDQGSNLGPLHWKHGTLATGSPGKA